MAFLVVKPNKHGPFWHLNHPGCWAYHAAHPVVPISCTLLGAGVISRLSIIFPAKLLGMSQKTGDFVRHFDTLTVIRSQIFFC